MPLKNLPIDPDVYHFVAFAFDLTKRVMDDHGIEDYKIRTSTRRVSHCRWGVWKREIVYAYLSIHRAYRAGYDEYATVKKTIPNPRKGMDSVVRIVLHEVAHAIHRDSPRGMMEKPHGPEFTAILADLVVKYPTGQVLNEHGNVDEKTLKVTKADYTRKAKAAKKVLEAAIPIKYLEVTSRDVELFVNRHAKIWWNRYVDEPSTRNTIEPHFHEMRGRKVLFQPDHWYQVPGDWEFAYEPTTRRYFYRKTTYPGWIETRRSRVTGEVVVVSFNETLEGKKTYHLACEKHDLHATYRTLGEAKKHAALGDHCPECIRLAAEKK
jgi:hypothetical protein